MSAAEDHVREVIAESSLVQLVSKAELDQQIATAHAYPRSLKRFRDECLSMATLNAQVADECIYAVPRKEQGVTKMIEGPSARLAEIVASAWGNCRAGARVVDEGREFVTAQGVFHDLERNVAITYEVRRKIVGKYGRFSPDMIATTSNAACSIALRNAVFKGVPKAFWNDIYEAARKVCAGDVKTLANRRSDMLAYLQKLGATQEMVLATLGVKGIEDIGLEQLTSLRGLANSIKDGEITVEDAFAPKDAAATGSASRADQAKDALRGAQAPTQQPAQQTPAAGGANTEASSGAGANAQQTLVGGEPKYNEESAIAEIRKAKTEAGLDRTWQAIVKDFAGANRQLPVSVEAARNERREAIKQAV